MKFLTRTVSVKILILPIVFVVALAGAGVYYYLKLDNKLKQTVSQANNHINYLENALASSTHDNSDLTDALTTEQQKNQTFSNELVQLQGTVGTLVKLSKTDPELLKKYSKVYFLNENYIPAKLADIDPNFLFEKTRKMQMNAEVWPFMQLLLTAAKNDGINLQIASAYRSFSEQSALKANYKVVYGTGANKFSADQGYSEHQLGTTVDFTTPDIGGGLLGFEKTAAYTWLMNNAYKYGFILSYPKDNKYYIYEPWHWRFVSVALAATLHDNGKSFYDMDQRAIDFYLVSFFDMP
jgi:LAS superfamily LD-carboxypeptidase LdcB